MINVVVFVVRYFGGTKLGIPGLIEAYSKSAEGLIKKNNIKLWFLTKRIQLEYPYSIEKLLSNLFQKFNAKIIKQHYDELIFSEIELNINDIDSFLNALSSIPSCSIKKT